jgi:hypothetical protein
MDAVLHGEMVVVEVDVGPTRGWIPCVCVPEREAATGTRRIRVAPLVRTLGECCDETRAVATVWRERLGGLAHAAEDTALAAAVAPFARGRDWSVVDWAALDIPALVDTFQAVVRKIQLWKEATASLPDPGALRSYLGDAPTEGRYEELRQFWTQKETAPLSGLEAIEMVYNFRFGWTVVHTYGAGGSTYRNGRETRARRVTAEGEVRGESLPLFGLGPLEPAGQTGGAAGVRLFRPPTEQLMARVVAPQYWRLYLEPVACHLLASLVPIVYGYVGIERYRGSVAFQAILQRA